MCYVIVTSRTLLWTLLTISGALGMLSAIVSPQWLVGTPRSSVFTNKSNLKTQDDITLQSQLPSHSIDEDIPSINSANDASSTYTPTVGIFNRCTRIQHTSSSFQYSCAPFINDFSVSDTAETSEDLIGFPGFWKASLVFLSFGLVLMIITVGTSIIGCCMRAIFKKSIFTISGTIQAFAGLFYIFGLVLYPAGWSSKRVNLLCGDEASYYTIGTCSIGWAFYLALISSFITFVCAILSVYADSSTSSDKVQDEIFEGKNLICLL
ncbi:hypothetical protein CHUAL_010361 [Chamberlinius hualienensis]